MEPSNRGVGLRTKVVIASVLVLALSTVLSVLAVRQILLSQLRAEIDRSLTKEVGEFRSVLAGADLDDDPGDDPGEGSTGSELAGVFDTYLAQNIPSEGEEVLTILQGKPYLSERSHDAGLPLESLGGDVQRWGSLDAPEMGELSTPVGELIYIAEPVTTPGGATGVLVIANAPEFEIGEIQDVTRTMALVGVVVVAVGSILSWVAAGRVVAPIGGFTRTARSITDSDLNRRIDVKGTDEVALLAETFNDMLDRLEEAFTTQRQFVDDAGHELRTPITIVRGHLELMSNDPNDRAETLTLVMGELARMDRIVNDLLFLSNASQPGFLEVGGVDVADLTDEIHAKASAIADREWLLEGTGQGRFLMDHQRVTQAMMQLAANAARHTPGGPITIGSSTGPGGVRLWVRDTGPGIDAATQERIFERFSRGDGPRHSDGAGLGLAIVKAIAEAHGGTVTLESRRGVGSTFTLVLPVRAARDEAPTTSSDVRGTVRS
ncbi:MAG: sensor histidine kinase [Actinomycetota bacterium]